VFYGTFRKPGWKRQRGRSTPFPTVEACAVALRTTIDRYAKRKADEARPGVEKRRQRKDRQTARAVRLILAGIGVGPQSNCFCCKKSLTDNASIGRGIGPECWNQIANEVEAERERLAEDTLRAKLQAQHGLLVP
jgi:hypothetical protein